jgi:hypothetical protein
MPVNCCAGLPAEPRVETPNCLVSTLPASIGKPSPSLAIILHIATLGTLEDRAGFLAAECDAAFGVWGMGHFSNDLARAAPV